MMNKAFTTAAMIASLASAAIVRTDNYSASWADPMGTTGAGGLTIKDMQVKAVLTQNDDKTVVTDLTMTVNLRDGKSIGATDELEMIGCQNSSTASKKDCTLAAVDSTKIKWKNYVAVDSPVAEADGAAATVKAFDAVSGWSPSKTCKGGEYTKSSSAFAADASPCSDVSYTGVAAGSSYSGTVVGA